MSARGPVNSSRYWDSRFSEDWETFEGPRQSRFFARIALEHLPSWLTDAIWRDALSVADWGCAQGDGTDAFAPRVRPGRLVGIDFSATAIEQARARYPNTTFRCEDWLDAAAAPGERFDVVLSSNTLEHFHDPASVLDAIAARARRAVVLVLPYREQDRIDEHFASFFPETIRQRLSNGFTLHWSQAIDCRPIPGTSWAGEQIVLVWADPAWTAPLELRLDDVLVEREPDGGAGAHAQMLATIGALQQDIATMRAEQSRLTDAVGATLAAREARIETLQRDLAARDHALEALRAESGERIAGLEQRAAEREAESATLRLEAAASRAQADERERQVRELWASTSWRVTRPLRAAVIAARSVTDPRNRYRLAKSTYWALPEPLRRRLDGWRHRYVAERLALAGSAGASGPAAAAPAPDTPRPDWLRAVDDAQRVVVVPCGFEFDELVNQRPINAAKHYAGSGCLVVFVAWQWSPGEPTKRGCAEVWPGVHQVPLYEFLRWTDRFGGKGEDSLYLLTMPAPALVDAVPALRRRGYSIVYDIMDEWEEFNRSGQAPWYSGEAEARLVMQADWVCAVAPSLVAKFAGLRTDIEVVGNGYSPDVLGAGTRGIAGTQGQAGHPVVGYFGHLTDAWFDWATVFGLAARFPGVRFEIIGYGEPEWVRRKAEEHPNVALLGKVHPSALHTHVRRWTHGMIPFVEGPLARAVDPIKIYEYLWFGLPTFVGGIEHLRTLPGVAYAAAADAADTFEAFLRTPRPEGAALDAFLERTTWAARFERLSERVAQRKGLATLYGD